MSLAGPLNSRQRRPTGLVWLDGQPCQIPDSPGAISINGSFGQPIRGGTITLRRPPIVPKIRMPVIVRWGYDGITIPAFTGFVTNPGVVSYPNDWTLQIQDILWLADYVSEGEIVLDNQEHTLRGTPPTDYFGMPNWITAQQAIIRLLRDWAGIPESRLVIPKIYIDADETEEWYLGQLSPVSWSEGTSPLQAVQQICDPMGYWIYADAAGVVRMIQISGAPTDQAAVVWRRGVDLLVKGPPRVDGDVGKIYNRVEVTGGNTGIEGAAVRDEWATDIDILPPGKHRSMQYSNALIEYVNEADAGAASCTAIARRMVREHGRIPATVTMTVKANPYLTIGSTVGLLDANVEYPDVHYFFLYSLATSLGGAVFEQSVTLDGGLGPEGYTLVPPPTAAFTWRLVKETLTDGDYVEVICDGGASASMGGGEIASWTWSDDSVPQQIGEGVIAVFIYKLPHADPTITLAATDVNGKVGLATQTIPLAGDELETPGTRALSVAAGATWYVTPDGGQTWNSETGQTALAVPPISSAGSVLADQATAATVGILAGGGASGATLRSSADYLATASTPKATLAGPISFLWQNEKNPLRVWAAVGGTIHLSLDGGVTFGAAITPTCDEVTLQPEADLLVRWIVESSDTEGVVDVLIGRFVLTTFDAGAHWTVSLDGPPDSKARCYVSGHDRHWVGYSDLPDGSSPLRSTEGDTCAFPIDTEPAVTAITAVTMMVDTPDVYAFDSEGRIWRTDAPTGGNTEYIMSLPDV